jgi:choline transport protein
MQRQVRPGWDIPLNAILVTLFFTTLLSLLTIGSTIAFNVITSLGRGTYCPHPLSTLTSNIPHYPIVGLVSSYIIAIACILRKRLANEPLLPSRFSLGKFGIPVNIIALSFLSLAFVFLYFPAAPRPSAETMNWSSLIYGSIIMTSLGYYWIWGRHTYVGPVEYVKWRDDT